MPSILAADDLHPGQLVTIHHLVDQPRPDASGRFGGLPSGTPLGIDTVALPWLLVRVFTPSGPSGIAILDVRVVRLVRLDPRLEQRLADAGVMPRRPSGDPDGDDDPSGKADDPPDDESSIVPIRRTRGASLGDGPPYRHA